MGLAVALSHYFTLCKTKAELVVVDVTDVFHTHCPPVEFPPQFAGAVCGVTDAHPGPKFKSNPSSQFELVCVKDWSV